MSGRPKETPTKFKAFKAYHEPGRYTERLRNKEMKEQKIAMLETLIAVNEKLNPPDLGYIRDLYKRANLARDQLKVLSTVDPYDFT